jgi:hypothetical protein
MGYVRFRTHVLEASCCNANTTNIKFKKPWLQNVLIYVEDVFGERTIHTCQLHQRVYESISSYSNCLVEKCTLNCAPTFVAYGGFYTY